MSSARQRPFLIGLTGNIATGKSTVLALLAERGADGIDADQEVHALYEPGSPISIAVAAAFGPAVLAQDGSVNRRALGQIVFADPERLQALERITHPAVRQRIEARIALSRAPVVVIDAIKLFEGGLAERCDSIWVVTAPPAVQRERLMQRNSLTTAEADQRITAQPAQDEKIQRADVVIDNSGTYAQLVDQVDAAWEAHVAPHLAEPHSK